MDIRSNQNDHAQYMVAIVEGSQLHNEGPLSCHVVRLASTKNSVPHVSAVQVHDIELCDVCVMTLLWLINCVGSYDQSRRHMQPPWHWLGDRCVASNVFPSIVFNLDDPQVDPKGGIGRIKLMRLYGSIVVAGCQT